MFNFSKNDNQIQKDVTSEILWDPRVSSTHISVAVKNGVVTLRGDVPHYLEKSAAEHAAQRVSGVKAVADEIDVKMMGSYERTDEDIAQAALNAFAWNISVPKDLMVTVEKGWVTLSGEAEWDFERTAAKNAVASLMGVCGVSNTIKLRNTARVSDIKMRIEDALQRSAESEGKSIKVTVNGGDVALSGKVNSVSEIEDARFAAWCAPGVISVENNMTLAH